VVRVERLTPEIPTGLLDVEDVTTAMARIRARAD
jgi:hypothetical protein